MIQVNYVLVELRERTHSKAKCTTELNLTQEVWKEAHVMKITSKARCTIKLNLTQDVQEEAHVMKNTSKAWYPIEFNLVQEA